MRESNWYQGSLNSSSAILPLEEIAPLIKSIRNQRVILDAELSRIYGVQTRALNQAVKRNADRFPEDFIFDVSREEILGISQTVTSLRKLKFAKRARAFTEHGALKNRIGARRAAFKPLAFSL